MALAFPVFSGAPTSRWDLLPWGTEVGIPLIQTTSTFHSLICLNKKKLTKRKRNKDFAHARAEILNALWVSLMLWLRKAQAGSTARAHPWP